MTPGKGGAGLAEPAVQRTAKRPKNRKAQISMAAARLFCERGYHGVGVDEIAAAVGISGPAVYRHFPNKYAVLVHATRELIDVATAAGEEGLNAPGTPAERLDLVLEALARVGVERREVSGLYQWEGRYLTPEHREEFHRDTYGLVVRTAKVLREERPELTPFAARLLVRAAFSALSSPATHRAPMSRNRGVLLLRRAGHALLATTLPDLPPPPPAPKPQGARPPSGGDRAPAPPAGVSSRREVLISQAIALFHQHGYHQVGIEDIGRAAGIQPSSVYRYFPGKADLLAAAYYRAAERMATMTAGALETATGPEDALRRMVDSYVDLAFNQTHLVSVYLAENNNLPERDRHELRKLQRLQVEEWVRLLAGIRTELTTSDARVLVHAALNVVTDLGASGAAPPPPELAAPVAHLALAVLTDS
jgi:AcrR family transcriptional regulator